MKIPGYLFRLTLLSIFLLGCTASVESTSKPTAELISPTPESMQPSKSSDGSITPEEETALMDALISGDKEQVQYARQQILESDDPRFIPVMIELMRAAQIGLVDLSDYRPSIEVLELLSSESYGDDWPAWIEWYGATDIEPPVGFTGWKGRLLGRIDPRFSDFLRDDVPSNIRVEEIQWGGVRVDGIPALDNPTMLAADEADYLLLEEPVFGLYLEGEARAYPLRILDWHEMANDVFGDQPVSLAYCTLCGAAIAFDGHASNGETYTFGSSGFLFRSNKLMYDRQTRTLWNQFTGEPVLGDLVGQDVHLNILPVVLTTWEDWKTQHPDTSVVALETGYDRVYQPGAAYGHYFSADTTMFPVWQRSNLLDTKDQVYAVRIDGQAKAYPISTLLDEQVVNDIVGGTKVVLITQNDRVLVEAQSLRAGKVTYSPGAEVRAYERGGEVFSTGTAEDEVLDADFQPWIVREEALIGPNGERLERLGGHLAYWFGWYAFFPNTQVYGFE
jgi:hypothetical protein